jgi:dTDP-4-amino-4,6-dideoxygalactose transaminase
MSPQALEKYLAGCTCDAATGRPVGTRSEKRIKAIVPVHIYGQVAEMDAILAIAAKYDLAVIEDACQAHGAEYRSADGLWRRAGAFGHAAAFSFYPGKNLGACGEAGAVTTDDDHVARTIRMLRDHGQARKYFHDLEGYNGRLDAIQAAFLRTKLQHLDSWNAQRREAAVFYDELLSHNPGIVTPVQSERSRSVYHLYVVRHDNRDALAEHLKSEGVSYGFHYPVPLHLQACYASWGYAPGALPVTEQVARTLLSLPMFPGITAGQRERVSLAVASFTQVGAGK